MLAISHGLFITKRTNTRTFAIENIYTFTYTKQNHVLVNFVYSLWGINKKRTAHDVLCRGKLQHIIRFKVMFRRN